ncbi:hypothetical protein [Photobacterium damselae]|uniref:hypothetical protein n=1 Tax=Photobacterium damselae TaxID=38293 RepID=UPI0030F403F5
MDVKLLTDSIVSKFLEKNPNPMAIRDLEGMHIAVNSAWTQAVGMSMNGKKLSDLKSNDPLIQSSLVSCQIFDSLVTTSSTVMNETFGFKPYFVLRAPITINNKQCLLVQALPM